MADSAAARGDGYRTSPLPIGLHSLAYHENLRSSWAQEFILCLGYKGEIIQDYFRSAWHAATTLTRARAEGAVPHPHDEEDWTVTLLDAGAETQTGGRLARPACARGNFLFTYGDGLGDYPMLRWSFMKVTARVHRRSREAGWSLWRLHRNYHRVHRSPSGTAFCEWQLRVFNRRIGSISFSDDCILERQPLEQLAGEGQLKAIVIPLLAVHGYLPRQQQLEALWAAACAVENLVGMFRIYSGKTVGHRTPGSKTVAQSMTRSLGARVLAHYARAA